MLDNSWFKKEKPLLGLTGLGGGVGSISGGPSEKSSGGYTWTVVGDDSHEYQYHMWLTGSPAPEKEFTANEDLTNADVLIGGGGGGGGGYAGGGGGAGGLLIGTNMTVSAADSTAVGVSNHSSAGANWSNPGTNGSPSSMTLNGVVCNAGGGGYGGGAESAGNPRTDASGGGGSRGGQGGGSGTMEYVPTPGGTLTGYAQPGAGGATNSHPNYAGGGGGGTLSKGCNGVYPGAEGGGPGGNAIAVAEFAGGLIYPTDVPADMKKMIGGGNYAAGGGGGKEMSSNGTFARNGGAGGSGGGGQGGFYGIQGQKGITFGSGGGGGGQDPGNAGMAGGMGQAGIVMLRYPLGVKQTATGAVCSGGTENTPGNGYKYHTFTSPGTITVNTGGEVEVLMIGAGGGGASSSSCCVGQGGGGAGGCLHGVITLTASPYPISIGGGSPAGSGGNTTFAGFTGYGGGRGGYYNGTWSNTQGVVGGCSGGHAHAIQPDGSGGNRVSYGTPTMSPGPDNPDRGLMGLKPTQAPQTQPYGTLTGYGSAGGQGSCGGPGGNSSDAARGGGGGGIGGCGLYGTPGNTPDFGWADLKTGAGGQGRAFPGFPGPGIGVPALGPTGLLGGGGGASVRTNYPSQIGGGVGGMSGPTGTQAGGAQGAPTSGPATGLSGTANTGGGGGGGNGGPAPGPSGPSGGSGLVVIRYKV